MICDGYINVILTFETDIYVLTFQTIFLSKFFFTKQPVYTGEIIVCYGNIIMHVRQDGFAHLEDFFEDQLRFFQCVLINRIL